MSARSSRSQRSVVGSGATFDGRGGVFKAGGGTRAVRAARVAAALRPEGLEVVAVYDTELLMPAARQCRPDLVVMDLGEPSDGGLPRLAQFRSDPNLRHAVVILLADRADRGLVHQVQRLGVRDLILRGPGAPETVAHRAVARLGVCANAGAAAGGGGHARPGGESSAPAEPRSHTSQKARPPSPASPPAPPPMETALEMLKLLSPVLPKSDILDRIDQGVELRALATRRQPYGGKATAPADRLNTAADPVKRFGRVFALTASSKACRSRNQPPR